MKEALAGVVRGIGSGEAAKKTAEFMRKLQDEEATDDDRREALEHLHPLNRAFFEDRW